MAHIWAIELTLATSRFTGAACLVVRCRSWIRAEYYPRALARRLPQGPLSEIAERGHNLHLTQVTEFNATVAGFLLTLQADTGLCAPGHEADRPAGQALEAGV